MRKVFYTLITLMLLAAFLLPACAKPTPISTPAPASTPTVKPQSGGVLRIIAVAKPTVFGYPPAIDGTSFKYSSSSCVETLLSYTSTGDFKKVLATDYKVASDLKSITFTIRKGVKFQDGTDLNTQAVKWNLDQHPGSTAAYYAQNWGSVDIIDDYTVRLNFKTAIINTDLAYFSSSAGAMVSPTAVKNNGADWAKTHPVGTGPFKFKNFVRDTSLEYERFDDYWGGKPYLDGVKYTFMADFVTAILSFKAGEADALEISDMQTVANDIAGYQTSIAYAKCMMLVPDSANSDSPLANQKVREAVEYAIDRPLISKKMGFGYWEALNQASPSWAFGYIPALKGREYNPAKARQLLADAGYANGLTISIITSSSFDNSPLVAVQSYLKDVGIEAKLNVLSFSAWNEIVSKTWNNGLLYATQGVTDPNYCSFLNRYYSYAATRYPCLARSTELKDTVQSSLATFDYKTQVALGQKAVQLLFDQAVITPLWIQAQGYVLKQNVHDTGFYSPELAHSNWTPEKAWLSK